MESWIFLHKLLLLLVFAGYLVAFVMHDEQTIISVNNCPHSEQDMGVGIVSRRMGVMDGKVSNHAFGNKLLLAKLPDKDSVLVGRYLSGDGKHPPPCKLGVPLLLHRFGGVP